MPVKKEYSTVVYKSGEQTPVIDIQYFKDNPGVVEKRKGSMATQIITADKKGSLLYKNEGRR
jgi:myo-inositol-hexaphosphate 3-phosphohydrolase